MARREADQELVKAMREAEEQVTRAKQEAEQELNRARQDIQAQLARAQQELRHFSASAILYHSPSRCEPFVTVLGIRILLYKLPLNLG